MEDALVSCSDERNASVLLGGRGRRVCCLDARLKVELDRKLPGGGGRSAVGNRVSGESRAMVDLSVQSGLPLVLDTKTPTLRVSGDFTLLEETRTVGDLAAVLVDPQGLPPATPAYWIYRLEGPATAPIREAGLIFSFVLIAPLRVGPEFVKTQGHCHGPMPGSSLGYPEVYSHVYGTLYLLLQRQSREEPAVPDDCVLIPLHEAGTVTIPPGYAHVLVNPAGKPALMAGLYSAAALPDYQLIRGMGGLAYHVLKTDGREAIVPNPRYGTRPPLRTVVEVSETTFAPPDGSRSLWASATKNLDRYRMLYDSDAAERYFDQDEHRS